ncbi:MAG: TlpA family protein disulfide reductase [Candidatus Heimdallarchaeota archaeon]|nr:TlpA family protein disulfide reductase [Candidatus Heimdallarchaeota archaeon]
MRKIITLILILIFSVVLTAQEKTDQDIKKAQNFFLEDLDGDFVELDEITGEGPILLSFWATWCKPCIEEMKELNRIYEEYKSEGFNLVAISIDSEKSVSRVKPFIKSKNYDFTVLFDTNSEVARIYYAQAVPYTVLLDENGSIVYSHMGYKKGDEIVIENLIKSLIQKS